MEISKRTGKANIKDTSLGIHKHDASKIVEDGGGGGRGDTVPFWLSDYVITYNLLYFSLIVTS